jgi:RNA polymerase sigma-70 factor (ECF subfamily)
MFAAKDSESFFSDLRCIVGGTWSQMRVSRVDREESNLEERRLDVEALRAIRNGNASAFRGLVDRYQRRVYATMQRMVRRRADAEDLTQQAFLEAYAALDRFDPTRPFLTWLLRIAVNNCRDHLKSHKRREQPSEMDTEGGQALHAGRVEGPEEEAVRRRRLVRLEAALGKLDDKYRIPLVLKDIEGLSYQEIQQVVELPLTTLKIRVVRGREQLLRLLRDETNEGGDVRRRTSASA